MSAARTGGSEEDAGEDARRTCVRRLTRNGGRVGSRGGSTFFLRRAIPEFFVRRLAVDRLIVVAVGRRRLAANLVALGVGQGADSRRGRQDPRALGDGRTAFDVEQRDESLAHR